uniref:Uncharacterized protein n=1 Tax=Anopheles culicifacies TaxID=139723 RepID=A0A182LZV1_9DIPT
MYYYASKLSAVACGTRCRQGLARRQRTNRTNRQGQGGKKDDDEDSDDNSKDKKALSSFFCESTNDTIVISVKSSEQPEVCCESTPTLADSVPPNNNQQSPRGQHNPTQGLEAVNKHRMNITLVSSTPPEISTGIADLVPPPHCSIRGTIPILAIFSIRISKELSHIKSKSEYETFPIKAHSA